MQQTSINSVSSVASVGCWGALWAALLADEQVCSGCEPWRYEQEIWRRDRPCQHWVPLLPLSTPERAAGEMAVGAAPTPWREGKGALLAFPCQWAVGYSHFPKAQHPFLQASWRVGDNASPQDTKKIAPVLRLLRWTQKHPCLRDKGSGDWLKARWDAQLWLEAAP